MPGDTLPTPDRDRLTLDSVKKLVPLGFFVLNEIGARRSIKASIDAQAYFQKWQVSDDALGKMAASVSVVSMQRNQAMETNVTYAAKIELLTTKLKTANTWKIIGLAGMAILTTKIILKP